MARAPTLDLRKAMQKRAAQRYGKASSPLHIPFLALRVALAQKRPAQKSPWADFLFPSSECRLQLTVACKTKRAQKVAKKLARMLRTVCQDVVAKQGAASKF